MPTVPRYGDSKVNEAPIPGARTPTDAPAAAFGTSQRPAAAAQSMLDTVGKFVDEQTRQANQLQVLDADRQLSALETNIQYDPKGGIINRKGKDAFGLPDEVRGTWDKGVSEIEKGLKNDVQKAAFRGMTVQRWGDLDKNVQRHVSSEMRSYDDQVTTSYIENEQNAAALNYMNTERIAMSIERQKASLIDHAQRNGLPGEWVKQRVLETESKTHSEVVARMLANDQDVTAKAYYDANREGVTGTDATRLEKALEEGGLRGESQRRVDAIMGKGLTRTEALAEVQKIEDPKLRDATEDRVSRAFEQRRAAERQDQENLYDQAANLLDSGPRGAPARSVIPPADWAALSLEQKNALQKRAEDPVNSDKTWLDFLSLSPQEIGALSRAQFETKYWANFDKEHRGRAETLWNAATSGKGLKDPQLAATLTFNDRVENTLRTTGLIDPNEKKSKFSEGEATLYAKFETAAAREVQDYEVNTLGGKRKATGEEMQKIIEGLAIKRVFIDKPWARDPEKPAGLVAPDDRGRAYVPIDQIPAGAMLSLKTEAQRLRVKPGSEAFERAYGAILTGERDDDRIRDILRGK